MSEASIGYQLVRLLADGEYHSGEELGKSLNISRAAIWKRLEALRDLGLEYESVRGKGYRLVSKLDLLSLTAINQHLEKTYSAPIQIVDQVDSTNAKLLRHLAENTLQQSSVIVAEMQTAGRGRRGRSWLSPYASNINLSMYRRFDQGVAAIDGLSLVVALAVAKVLKQISPNFSVKWPNDVLYEGKKVAGILLELSGDPTGTCHIIIGIGLNVNITRGDYINSVGQSWTSLAQITQHSHDRNQLAAQLINSLNHAIETFENKGFTHFKEQWLKSDALIGHDVVVYLGERAILGQAKGVSDKGELKVLTANGLELFNGGEVSLRKSYDHRI